MINMKNFSFASILYLFLMSACAHKTQSPPIEEKTAKHETRVEAPKSEIPSEIIASLMSKKSFKRKFSRANCDYGEIPAKVETDIPHANFAPAVVCTVKGKKHLSNFSSHWKQYEWIEATSLPVRKATVAVADFGVEGGMESMPVFKTEDKGVTWKHIGELHKPHFSAKLTKLIFESPTNGKATLDWDRDSDKFEVETKDGGRTWSAPYTVR